MVWRYAISFPRLVEVHPVLLKLLIEPRETMNSHGLKVAHYRSLTPVPALLSTCRESRFYALRMYKRTALATDFVPDSVYFEYEVDTMYLGASVMDRFTRSSEFVWDPHPAIFQGGERYITVGEMRNDNPLDLVAGKPSWGTLRSLRSLALDAKWVLRPLGDYRGMGVHVCRASVREVCRGMTSLWKTCMEWKGLREVMFVLHVQEGARMREDGETPLEILRDEVREHMERHVQFVNSYSYDGADHLRRHIGACGRNYSEMPYPAILWLDGKEKRCPDVRILYQLAGRTESGDGNLEWEWWEGFLNTPAPPCEREACRRLLSLS